MLDLLNHFDEKTKNGKNEIMNSCLIILYTNKTSDIYKSLNLLKFKQDLDINMRDCLQIKIGKDESNVEIIVSDFSGVGKSTQIKLNIEKSKKKYIYFPFGGVINREDTVKRLKDLKLSEQKKCGFHLDLYDTDQTDLMTEFLFSILITKIYGHGEDLFYFPKEIEIKIEIPNGFVDLINKFPILTFFDQTILLLRELPPLIVSKDVTSNVQIVANFLKFKDKTDKYDLYFKGLTPEIFSSYKTKLDAQVISQKECEQLIFDEIKKTIDQPNYYQITSFIDVLATQFKAFNRNYFINAELLTEFRIDKSIRSLIINSYIKLTKHFTKGAFTELIQTQEETRKQIYSNQYNSEEEVDEGIKKLSNIKPNLISFDKFNYSLIFFHEGTGERFSIISNLPSILGDRGERNDNSDEFYIGNIERNKLHKLYNFQNKKYVNNVLVVEEEKELPNYKKYSQEDFLNELKEILDLKTPVKATEEMKKENEKIWNYIENIKKENEEIKKRNQEKNQEDEKEQYQPVPDYEIKKKKSLEDIVGKYVFTADNFIKMILILLRIRANIPVIMMGETGCGKTSLIKMLSRLLKEGNENNSDMESSDREMKVLNIHAGTSDNDIIDFIKKEILEEAKKIHEDDEKEKEKRKKNNQIFIPRKIWVFLDEINTCKSMGLISELMCKHTYQGQPLPPNIVFIAACNPYRCYEKGKKITIGLDINQAFKEKKNLNEKDLEKLNRTATSNLVYTVNPLPHSLLNYVFDFGNLEPNDEEKYIQSIVEEPIKRIGGKTLKEEEIPIIHEFATKLILKAQNFTRDNNEISSVSLREIRRFNIFYEFFFDYLNQKKKAANSKENIINMELDTFYKNCNDATLHKYSIILGIFVCYYLRIVDNETRQKFEEMMNKEIKEIDKSFKDKDFIEVPLREEKYVLANMELEKGIAQNRALLDNTFSLFVAINNKIPIFIVGKPGCSKSLSVQLINKSMKGSSSNKPLFRIFPKIILSSYQGSMASTSQGVEKIFKQAKQKYERLNDENKKNNISMIYFDEMGLAEHSPNNPLKVIHAQLDEALDEGNNKIAFVGISNWTLDASKMNRGMHLSIPEPSKEDTKKTAFTIGESYDISLANQYKQFYEDLGLAYFKYKKILKNKYNKKEDFHGNRDFYHLIKYSAREIIKSNKQKEENKEIEKAISFSGLERNFGGLKFISENNKVEATSIRIIKTIYCKKKCDNNYEVLSRIKENINDIKSRYLLVISKSSASIFLLQTILKEINKEYNLYVGSQFYKDHHSEEYSLKILNKIQLHMEEGKVLILKNLESVYPALYDLFNQNFTKVSKKNYARIAIGSSTNTFSLVDDNFRCIVSVNYEQIDQEEPPFLNRFEKHIVSLDYLLSEELRKESIIIYKKLSEMISLDKKIYKGINYDLYKLFINFDLEEIQGIMYQASLRGIKVENMIDEVISKISLILPQDIILCLKLNGYQTKFPDIFNKIMEGYNKGEHHNFRRFLESMTKYKNIIYTYTNNLETIKIFEEDIYSKIDKTKKDIKTGVAKQNITINTKICGTISKENIKEIKISSFKTENEFETEINGFFEEKNYKICLIKFNSNEGNFINYVQFFIENKLKEYTADKGEESIKKVFIFIVNMMRVYDSEIRDFKKKSKKERRMINKKILRETISNLSEYYQIFIDNLNGLDKIDLEPIFKSEGLDIYENFLDFNYELTQNIYMTLSYMKLNIPFSFGELNEANYLYKLINYIGNNEEIKKNFNDFVKKHIGQANKNTNKDLILGMFEQEDKIKSNDKDIIGIIHDNLSYQYADYLAEFYFKAEQDNFFATLLSMEEEKKNKTSESEKEYIVRIQEDIRKRYFAEFKIEKKNKILRIQGQNLINIYLGLKIPKIIPTLKKIIKYIKEEIEKNYIKNENSLRKEEDTDKNHYLVKLKNFNEVLSTKIIEISLPKEKTGESEGIKENEYLNMLLEDYYTFFIFENVKNLREKKSNQTTSKSVGINEVKHFLKHLVQLKNKENFEKSVNKENSFITNMAAKINWVQCYKDDLSTILQMFSSLSLVVDNLYDKIIEINKTMENESSSTNSDSSIVNNALFLGMESILRVMTSNKDIYISHFKNINEQITPEQQEIQKQNFLELLNIAKEVLQNAFKLETNLHLSTKEAFSLQEMLEIFDVLYQNEKAQEENIKDVVEYFSKQTSLIIELEKDVYGDTSNLLDHFENFYSSIEKLVGESDSFPKLISKIIDNEYSKIEKMNFRKKILEKIISKNEMIYNCYPLLKKTIKKKIISIQSKNIKKLKDLTEENDPILDTLNRENMDNAIFLEQAILQTYEYLLLKFFDNYGKINQNNDLALKKRDSSRQSIKKIEKNETECKKNSCLGDNLTFFEECVNYLNTLSSNSEGDSNEKSNLTKLYSIAYIKTYLTKFVEYFDVFDELEKNNICDPFKNENDLINVIKIYILKIIFNLNKRNFKHLLEHSLLDFEVFKIFQDQISQDSLLNLFLPLDDNDTKKFKEETNYIDTLFSSKERSELSDSLKYQSIENIDMFLSVAINKIISKLFLENYLDRDKEGWFYYKTICEYYKSNSNKFNMNLNKLLNLFFDNDEFEKKLNPKFLEQCNNKEFIGDPYESLLYGLRFCVQSLLNIGKERDENQNLFYSSILSEACLLIINGNYIPGNNAHKNKKLDTYNSLLYLLYNSSPDTGYYVCSCGYLYSIGPCGFPTEEHTSTCPDCKMPIGYGEKKLKDVGAKNHGMVIREGHYRIFKNEEQKKEQMSRWGDPDENIPNRTLEQYKKEEIDKILNSSKKGIMKITKNDFLEKNKTIRKISKITYRLLNFILYNHLFFANCLDYISNEDLESNCLVEGMNCLEIIQSNWNLLEEALKEKNIPSIQAFMNIIFKELSDKISKCEIIRGEDELIKFEESIENIVQNNIDKDKSCQKYKKYKEMNNKYNEIKEKDLKVIISETFPPTEDKYPESEFPFLKYFIYTNYKSDFRNSFEKEQNFMEKYPLLYRYLNLKDEQKLLKYLPDFNDFTNSMVEKYSYQIKREEAKTKKLKETNEFDEEKFKPFQTAWDNIYKYAIKFKCRDNMSPKQLTPEDELIYFLNDESELGNGMYLAAACQNFISWQNEFLQPIIESAKFNGILLYYLENMKKKIPLQEANHNQILSIEDCFKNSNYEDFDDLVYTFTQRDIYENDKINYQRYNEFKFDFKMIEEELGKLILPEKCLFENEDKLNFVIFWGEGFRGGQSEIIQKFYEKYPQVDLNDEERKKIYKDIQNLYKDENYNFKTFFGSMQLLIFYLGNNVFTPKEKINTVLNGKPDYLKIDEKFIGFFQNNDFKLDQFMNIFFYAEHLSFQELSKTLQPEYKQKIVDESIISEINKKIANPKQDDKIPWKDMASAVRRFISRYLVGDRQTTDIDEKQLLIYQLGRIDLWEEKFRKMENLEELITLKIKEFKILVGQAFNFYELIGKEDNMSIINKDKEDGKDNQDDVNNGGEQVEQNDSDNEDPNGQEENIDGNNETNVQNLQNGLNWPDLSDVGNDADDPDEPYGKEENLT